MKQRKKKIRAPKLRFLRAEVLAGKFDAPRNNEMSVYEALEGTKFAPGRLSIREHLYARVRRYELEAIEYRRRAFEASFKDALRCVKKGRPRRRC